MGLAGAGGDKQGDRRWMMELATAAQPRMHHGVRRHAAAARLSKGAEGKGKKVEMGMGMRWRCEWRMLVVGVGGSLAF